VVRVGDGVAVPWRWNVGSWQAVATGVTGFALVVFASVQVGVMRGMRQDEGDRTLVQRKHDTFSVLLQAEVIGRSVERRLRRARVEHPDVSVESEIEEVDWLLDDVDEQVGSLYGEFSDRLEESYWRALGVKATIDAKYSELLERVDS